MKIYGSAIKILIIISLLMLLISPGCTSNNDIPDPETNTPKIINMYVRSYDTRTLSAIKEFNSTSKVQIHTSVINTDEISTSEYKNKLTTSILAGEGPDIILDLVSSFPSLNKIVENKVFCNLDQYVNNDEHFNLSDYYNKVLDCGITNGQRYYIPLNFRIPILWSSKSLTSKNNIIIDESKWTFKDLIKIQSEHFQTAEKYLIVTDFNSIMETSWNDFINISQKKANLDNKNFIQLLEDYKTISPSILNYHTLKVPELFFEYMKKDSLLLAFGDIFPESVWVDSTAVNKILNSEVQLFLYPGIDGDNQPAGLVEEFVAVNNSCKYKTEAYNFIKLLLSEKFQALDGNLWLPVNKNAYNTILEKYCGENGTDRTIFNYTPGNGPQYTSIPLSDKLIRQLDNYINNMDNCYYLDDNILIMISEEVDLFLQGKQTSSQTAKAINNKVNLYLGE